ncbi:MAG: hypothetical protein ACR2JN_12380 [Lapillicoccus sp.]
MPGPASVREAPRAEIPWAQVGPGWTAAVWSAGAGPSSAGMLYLVGPSGTRYAVGQVGAGTQVADITADGRRILTTYSVDGTVDSVGDWDVAAGSVRNVPLIPAKTTAAHYTKPSAQALLLYVADGAPSHLERRGFDGSLQLRYPDVPGSYEGLLVTADGRDLVLETSTGMVVVGNAQGRLVRTLPPPAGTSRCGPVSWWADGRVLARCDTTSLVTPVSEVSNLWLYPLSGAPASQLTRAPAPGSPLGYMRAWAFSRGTLVQGVPPCGVGPLGLLTPSGTAEHVTLNLPRGSYDPDGGPDPVAVVGDTAYLTVASSCGGGGAPSRGLIAYDLVASTSRILLGPGANGGTVVGAVVIDPTR